MLWEKDEGKAHINAWYSGVGGSTSSSDRGGLVHVHDVDGKVFLH